MTSEHLTFAMQMFVNFAPVLKQNVRHIIFEVSKCQIKKPF